MQEEAFRASRPQLDADAEDLETVDGLVFSRAQAREKDPWKAMGIDRTVTGYGRFEPDYTLTNCMMTFVEVEVDTETGQVNLSAW